MPVAYTVFVRLPFSRGDFVDPPPANWDAVKDRALWEILSRPSQGNDIDWKAIADDFNVTLSFLLQQAAWLYDRQLSQVRAQMRKVGNTQSHSPSPAPGPGSVSGSGVLGGQSMRRAGSGGSRVPSRLSVVQKESQPSRTESSSSTARPGTRAGPVRTSSATTVTQVAQVAEATARAPNTLAGAGRTLPRRERPSLAILQRPHKAAEQSPSLSPNSNSESDSDLDNDEDEEEEEDDDDMVTSRAMPGGVRRFGKFSMHKPSLSNDDDDESPAFLPLPRDNEPGTQHMNATLRQQGNVPDTARRQMTGYAPSPRRELVSLDSSASSGVAIASPRAGPQRPTEPLSPQRVASLSRESSRRQGSANQSSEETPSMGSSFSDLDDASVTQSALEEALMSNMQHGGVASRMSTISQALRSRYL